MEIELANWTKEHTDNDFKVLHVYYLHDGKRLRQYCKHTYNGKEFVCQTSSYQEKVKRSNSAKQITQTKKLLQEIADPRIEVLDTIVKGKKTWGVLKYNTDIIVSYVNDIKNHRYTLGEYGFENTPWNTERLNYWLTYNNKPYVCIEHFSIDNVMYCKLIHNKTNEEYIVKVMRLIHEGIDPSKEPNISHGEKIISEILDDLNVKYEREKTFDDLKYIRNLRCDFYLPEYNAVIEFHGIQHYQQVEKFGNTIELIKIRDNIKKNYCIEKGIGFAEIPYYDLHIINNKYIKDIVQSFK